MGNLHYKVGKAIIGKGNQRKDRIFYAISAVGLGVYGVSVFPEYVFLAVLSQEVAEEEEILNQVAQEHVHTLAQIKSP